MLLPLQGDRCLKKISSKRLLVNMDHSKSHSLWHEFGLGFQDFDGALMKSAIDLDHPSQTRIETDLSRIFGPLPSDECLAAEFAEMPDRDSSTCFARYGCCAKEVCHQHAIECANAFAHEVSTRELPTGSLLKITLPGSAVPARVEGLYFLGACCKKPLIQVLMKACVSPLDPFRYCLEMDQGLPQFSTSHQLFLNILQRHQDPTPNIEIAVEVLSHDFSCDTFTTSQVGVCVLGTDATFKISSGIGSNKTITGAKNKVQTQLPFGLKPPPLPPRKRKHKKNTEAVKRAAQPKRNITTRAEVSDDSDSDSSSDSSSSSSSSSRDSSASSSDKENDNNDNNDDDDNVMPPTATACEEAIVVAEEAKALEATHERKEALAKLWSSQSHFVKQVGFDGEMTIAPTARSVCYHCSQKIAKGLVRCTYFWNERKPSRYMHASCVVPFVHAGDADRKTQAMEIMTAAVAKLSTGGSSSSDGKDFQIKEAVEKILREL